MLDEFASRVYEFVSLHITIWLLTLSVPVVRIPCRRAIVHEPCCAGGEMSRNKKIPGTRKLAVLVEWVNQMCRKKAQMRWSYANIHLTERRIQLNAKKKRQKENIKWEWNSRSNPFQWERQNKSYVCSVFHSLHLGRPIKNFHCAMLTRHCAMLTRRFFWSFRNIKWMAADFSRETSPDQYFL